MNNLTIKNYSRLLLSMTLITVSYFVLGVLSHQLSLPPNYATLIWAPAGLALFVIIHFGYRYWPSIFLGATIFTLYVLSKTDLTFQLSLMIGLTLSIGSVLQALVGGYLVRKHISYPNFLTNLQDILKLILWGAVISCVINTSIGNVILFATKAISMSELPLNFTTWYLADMFGTSIITPLLILFFGGSDRLLLQRKMKILLPVLVCFISLILLFSVIKQDYVQLKPFILLWIFIIGLCLILITELFLFAITGATLEVNKIVEEKTKRLLNTQNRLRSI